MKTLIASSVAAALLIPGAATSAFAGPGDGYPGQIPTNPQTSVPKHADPGETVKVKVKLGVASNGNPCKGTIVVTVKKAGEGVQTKKSKKTAGGPRAFNVTFPEAGVYFVKTRFIPVDFSPCKGSHTIRRVEVG